MSYVTSCESGGNLGGLYRKNSSRHSAGGSTTVTRGLYDSYAKNVDSNIDFSTAQGFYLLSQKIDFGTFRTVVLDDRSKANDGGLLYSPEDTSLYGGAYVLIPRVGDYSQIHAYVQKYIFGE